MFPAQWNGKNPRAHNGCFSWSEDSSHAPCAAAQWWDMQLSAAVATNINIVDSAAARWRGAAVVWYCGGSSGARGLCAAASARPLGETERGQDNGGATHCPRPAPPPPPSCPPPLAPTPTPPRPPSRPGPPAVRNPGLLYCSVIGSLCVGCGPMTGGCAVPRLGRPAGQGAAERGQPGWTTANCARTTLFSIES